MTQQHTLTIKSSEIIGQVEARTFKFGKARDNGQADKLVNNVKLTDMGYDRSMVYTWVKQSVYTIKATFPKYSGAVTDNTYDSGHTGEDDHRIYTVAFTLSSKWDSSNGAGFDADCAEYIVNRVISDFLSLSLPREAEFYAGQAMQALKDAERKLYYKTA